MTPEEKLEAIKAEIKRKIAQIDNTIVPENEKEHSIILGELLSIRNFIKSIDEQSDNCYTCTNDKGCVTCENGELYKEKSTDYAKSNEEKAQEIVNINTERLLRGIRQNHDISKDERDQVRFDLYNLLLDMAEWKDEQFKAEKQALIDKACEWLKDNARNYHSAYATEDRLIEDFKKAMEE